MKTETLTFIIKTLTLEYRIIERFGIIGEERGEGLETFTKINNRGCWNNGRGWGKSTFTLASKTEVSLKP